MGEWKRPELLWRVILLAILIFAGLVRLPPQGVPSSSDLKLPTPDPEPKEKLVALTFDDGPRPGLTAQLLDGLQERGAKATFFVVGAQVELAPELVLRMAREGHQIGVHTYDHINVYALGREEFLAQVEGGRRMLHSLLGERDLWLRPPYGILDEHTLQWSGSPIILWSVDPEDWKDANAKRIREHLVDRISDGDIVLLHDIYPSSVEAALAAVDELKVRGFRFVTVAELLERKGIPAEDGAVYRRAETGLKRADLWG